ncbi:hypothetical protein, partial [Sporisorium scitamineum]
HTESSKCCLLPRYQPASSAPPRSTSSRPSSRRNLPPTSKSRACRTRRMLARAIYLSSPCQNTLVSQGGGLCADKRVVGMREERLATDRAQCLIHPLPSPFLVAEQPPQSRPCRLPLSSIDFLDPFPRISFVHVLLDNLLTIVPLSSSSFFKMSASTLATTSASQSTASMSAPSSTAMRSASASNDTSPQAKSNEDDQDKPKRTPCFRCRQSKVKCVYEGDNAPSCRRCLRLGVNCELQGKKEPLSWQMRVQHQLAALEGSLQSFLEKQMAGGASQQHGDSSPFDAGNKRSSFPRSRDSSSGMRMQDREGGSKKRRRTIASDHRASNDMQHLAYSSSSHSHTAESPIYADVNSNSASSYPSATHLSPRDAERAGHATDASNGLLRSLVATVAHAGSGSIAEASTSLPSDHALQDDDGVTTTAERRAFQTDDENDQASRPLSAIQKLRMSVLDRKKELSRSGKRVFPNLYRMATSDVGSKDPRPNVIKQDFVSPSDAVVLFRFFADYLDQYSFGFPTYRPDAIMSPMILTSVVCVASLHHAQLNRLHVPLKRDLIARLQTDDPSFPCSDVYETLFSSSSAYRSSYLQSNLHFEKELDP